LKKFTPYNKVNTVHTPPAAAISVTVFTVEQRVSIMFCLNELTSEGRNKQPSEQKNKQTDLLTKQN